MCFKNSPLTRWISQLSLFFCLLWPLATLQGDTVAVINPGFEDTTGQQVFNEFTFGIPVGWQRYDPDLIEGNGVFWGTLLPDGVEFFNGPAPEGDRVAILFNSTREGDGEYGLTQILSETLQPHRRYELQVEVGNIASGFATNGQFFNLDEFPGYRIELLAGNTVIAQDDNLLSIPEGEFATSTVQFEVGASHGLLGESLGIRLVNLNEIPVGFTQVTSPDLEVDFDNVRLSVTAIPEPGCLWLLACVIPWLYRSRELQNET